MLLFHIPEKHHQWAMLHGLEKSGAHYLVNDHDEKALKKGLGRWICVEANGSLPGEDRQFGGQDLYIDLVPESSWAQNARAALKPSQWNALSDYVRSRAGQCEVCGSMSKLETHERWHFEDKEQCQSLKRLIALCKRCHLSTHYGFATHLGKTGMARLQLMRAGHMTAQALDEHIRQSFALWDLRSKQRWRVDLSLLQKAGMSLVSRQDSPCIGVCLMDKDSGVCQGCARTLPEIAQWGQMGQQARRQAMEYTLPLRMLPKA